MYPGYIHPTPASPDTHRGERGRGRRTTYPVEVRLRPLSGLIGALACAGLVASCTSGAATSGGPSSPSAPLPSASAAPVSTPTATAPPSVGAPSALVPSGTAASGAASTGASDEANSTEAPVLITPTPTFATQSAAPKNEADANSLPAPDNRPAVPMPANPIGTSPLNGRPIGSRNPVLVVKLDNTRNAQPHAGLIDADVVYIEEVEYGITRIAAVFSSNVPKRIGPVRSARITDIDLFAQYGKPAFAYSGAQKKMLPRLAAASIYDVSPYRSYAGYSRDGRRYAPYNLFFNGRTGVQRAPKATAAHDMGFVFDKAVPTGGLNAKTAEMAWGYGSAGFTYDKADKEYRVALNGQPARAEEWSGGQRAATVVIQYVKQEKSPFYDKGGGNTPHADTIGSGTAMVMRDGLVWKTTWFRPNTKSGTTFTLPDGSLMTFRPGQLWIVLLDKKRPATIKPLTRPKVVATPTPTPTPAPAPDASVAPTAGPVPLPSASGQ